METIFSPNTPPPPPPPPPIICSISQGNSPTNHFQQQRNGRYTQVGSKPSRKKGPSTRLEFRRGGRSSALARFTLVVHRRQGMGLVNDVIG
ncbi:hypothetical protein SDJN02_17666, partial [Cucurbita argyrosperma subsp. argyrosperma]